MTEPTCEICRFSNLVPDIYVHHPTIECRIRSASPHFPLHSGDDWCGEFVAKEEPATEYVRVGMLDAEGNEIDVRQ